MSYPDMLAMVGVVMFAVFITVGFNIFNISESVAKIARANKKWANHYAANGHVAGVINLDKIDRMTIESSVRATGYVVVAWAGDERYWLRVCKYENEALKYLETFSEDKS
ncbi:MAG: hypothetical protein LBQ76_08540 [Candidatus Fibromonas sp.]|jgi:pyruvate/2-oxoglutarate/acetoin dehydrogenase E1 component|nr:hypothetical protein [Candidatus Fibromonas sp.]